MATKKKIYLTLELSAEKEEDLNNPCYSNNFILTDLEENGLVYCQNTYKIR